MRVRIKLMRNGGRVLTWNQAPREFEGVLSCSKAGHYSEPAPSYLFLPDDGPRLYDPKIKSVGENEMRIVGLEKVDSCWVLQEWNCEILA